MDPFLADLPPDDRPADSPDPVIEAPRALDHLPDPAGSDRRPIWRPMLVSALLAAALASASTAALIGPDDSVATSTSSGSGATAALVSTTTETGDAAIVAATTPSVVTISTSGTAVVGRGATVQESGVGTGIILTSDGDILTNAHVVAGASSLTVTLSDGSTHPATVVRADTSTDLAIIKIDATGLTPAALGSSAALQVGESVLAIGDPLGTFSDSVTKGIVSGLGRTITVADETTGQPIELTGLIQTDAAINPGNSGGPIVDAQGRVIGIAAAGSTNAEGLGFAIPIDTARTFIASVLGIDATV